MREEAKTEGSDSNAMTPADFTRVCMSNGLLKLDTSTAKLRLQSEIDDEDEDISYEDVFRQLQEKWNEREQEMLDRIASVEDEDLRRSLMARVERHHEVCQCAPSRRLSLAGSLSLKFSLSLRLHVHFPYPLRVHDDVVAQCRSH